MCEGNSVGSNETPHRRNHFRRRRQHTTDHQARRRHGDRTASTSDPVIPAVDEAPPVWVNVFPDPLPQGEGGLRRPLPSCQSCPLVAQTPQFLASLSLEDEYYCDSNDAWSPAAGLLLVQKTYVVAGTLCGRVYLWNAARAISSESRSSPSSWASNTTLHSGTSAAAAAAPEGAADASAPNEAHGPSPPLPSPGTASSGVPPPSSSVLRVVDLSTTVRGTLQEAGCVVGLVACPNLDDIDNDRDVVVVAATDLGVIAGIRVETGQVRFRFETKACGVTSVAVLGSCSAGADEKLSILVGYDIGVLERWEVAVDATSATRDAPTSKPKKTPPRLVAKAALESGYPIRAMAPLRVRQPDSVAREKDDGMVTAGSRGEGVPPPSVPEPLLESPPDTSSTTTEERAREYVLLTLEPEGQRSTASQLEVIDLKAVQASYDDAAARQSPPDRQSSSDNSAAVQLEAHRVLACPGMEVRDARGGIGSTSSSTANNAHLRRSPWIPSSGTNHVLDLSGVQCHDVSTWCAVGLADGTIGLVSAIVDGDHGWSWGIVSESGQLQFPYPCIGLGCLSMEDQTTDDKSTETARVQPCRSSYLACCLRGGTSYLLPLHDRRSLEDPAHPAIPTLKVLSYPKDLDEDVNLVQHVQGFAAGNIQFDPGEDLPVLVFAWPGGVVEVFACQLQTESVSFPPSLYESLQESGALPEVLRLLQDNDVSCHGPLWWAASREVLAHYPSSPAAPDTFVANAVVAPLPTRADLESDGFQSLRCLLMALAEVNGSD